MAKLIAKSIFSQEMGFLKPGEEKYRGELCLNDVWDFQPVTLAADFKEGETIPELPLPAPDRWESIRLKVPSPWNVNNLGETEGLADCDFNYYPSYPKNWNKVKMGWLKRKIQIPGDWAKKNIILHFEAVCGHCQVFLDRRKIGEHFDNSMPQRYDLSAYVEAGKDYELLVGIRAPALMNINNGNDRYTYPTGSFFNMSMTGIWQDVYLLGIPKVHIEDVFVQPDLEEDKLTFQVEVQNSSEEDGVFEISGALKALKPFTFPENGIRVEPHYALEEETILALPPSRLKISAGKKETTVLTVKVKGKLAKWDTENPNLYGSLLTIHNLDKEIDLKYTRFGWHSFKIKGGNLYLNDKLIQVKADSWHFIGIPEMTRRYAFAWYKAIKDAHGNGVRLHAMPYPRFFLELADEMGITVLDESAIWASHCRYNYNAPITWERFSDHVKRLVLRDRNHPSVMGWSVENEIRMAIQGHSPTKDFMADLKEKVCRLMDIARELDPTRDWISADGSHDWERRFPTYMVHYEKPDNYLSLKKKAGKPVGSGEGTIAYFGTPMHAATFTGSIAYRSILDRMKGVAIQTFQDLKTQREAGFSYLSVFNLAWYGLKPLPLGHPRLDKAPAAEDGIFFENYIQGKPGVQPERLPPYCTTFNPGFDPDLPLYQTWPMAEAIKAAYHPDGPAELPFCKEVNPHSVKELPQIAEPAAPLFIGNRKAKLYRGLRDVGVDLCGAPSASLVVADLASMSETEGETLKAKLKELKDKGGILLLTGLEPGKENYLTELLKEKVQIFPRESSSLVLGGEMGKTDPLVDHFRLEDLYLSESEYPVIQSFGLGGEILKDGKILLKACSCEWRRWNHRPEMTKTYALFRSELELPPAPALVALRKGKAQILLSTLEICEPGTEDWTKPGTTPVRKMIWHNLLKALECKVTSDYGKEAQAFSGDKLTHALFIGHFEGRSPESMLNDDYLAGESEIKPVIGDTAIRNTFSTAWQMETTQDGIFNLKEMSFNGPKTKSASYLSFYLDSPRRIDDLLTEPNVPELYLYMETGSYLRIWLNGKVIYTTEEKPEPKSQLKTRLLLGKGSNHVLIKIVNWENDNLFKGRLSSTDTDYLKNLGSSVERD